MRRAYDRCKALPFLPILVTQARTNNGSVLSLAPEAGLNKKKWLVNRFIIFHVFVLGSLLNRDFLQYLLVMHAI